MEKIVYSIESRLCVYDTEEEANKYIERKKQKGWIAEDIPHRNGLGTFTVIYKKVHKKIPIKLYKGNLIEMQQLIQYYKGSLYGMTITAKTIMELKRKASEIANKEQAVIDRMAVTAVFPKEKVDFCMYRYNTKTPWNNWTPDKKGWH